MEAPLIGAGNMDGPILARQELGEPLDGILGYGIHREMRPNRNYLDQRRQRQLRIVPQIDQPVVIEELEQPRQRPGGRQQQPRRVAEVPNEDMVQEQENLRMIANRLHTANRYQYQSIKRIQNNYNVNPENPVFAHAAGDEIQKANFLRYFTTRKRPRHCDFSDADLIYFLRLHAFCVPRTMNLIQSLKLKAIRYMADFDFPNQTQEQVYRIIASSVAAAMIVTEEEEMMLETVRTHSCMIEKFQPFFHTGLYREGFFQRGFSRDKYLA
jgi:hypothetical protein